MPWPYYKRDVLEDDELCKMFFSIVAAGIQQKCKYKIYVASETR
jgi:hypothetical protein